MKSGRTMWKRIVATAVSLALLVAINPPISAQAAAAVTTMTPQTVYLVTGTNYYSNILYGLDDIKNVTSSNRAVARPYSRTINQGSTATFTYDKNGTETAGVSGTTNSVEAKYQLFKAGTTKLSFTANGKKFEKKLTVKAYTNPLSSLVISNVNSGKNMASKLNKSSYKDMKIKKGGTVKVSAKAKSGWAITAISMSNWNSKTHDSQTRNYAKGVSSASYAMAGYTLSGYGSVNVHLQNKSNGGLLIVSVNLRK